MWTRLPITARVPFAVLFLGIRDDSALFLIALGAFFPIVVNTAAGVQRIPLLLVRAARMLGIRPYMLLPRVALPAALPSIFAGLRIGIGLAWVLGFVMWDAYYYFRMDIIIAAMTSVGLLRFVCDRLLLFFDEYLMRWSRGL